ncbi:M3 family peptidase, partial [Acinetobacter baumannii]
QTNPLLGRWSAPFGLAPFARVEPKHFLPAFKEALAAHKDEVKAITANAAKPTFANTIVALEKAGTQLDRVSSVFFNLTGADTNE